MIELGGNIELVGFSDRDSSEMVILKKIIGGYARKFADFLGEDYEKMVITLKQVGAKTSNKFEVNSKVIIKGKPVTSECIENNIFVCLAETMKKLEAQITKK